MDFTFENTKLHSDWGLWSCTNLSFPFLFPVRYGASGQGNSGLLHISEPQNQVGGKEKLN